VQNPSKTYSTAGVYTVTLNAINAQGSNTLTRTNYITVTAPAPDQTTGSINVQSTPAAANVFLDSTLVGLTPVTVTGVAPGSHTVRIEKTGYEPYQMTASVSAGATTLVSAALTPILAPTTGSVNIQSTPAGANAFLDGTLVGLTPVLVSGITPGSHQVAIEMTGYNSYQETVTVSAGATTLVSAVLTPGPTATTTMPTPSPTQTSAGAGTLYIRSSPFGARVLVDDVYRGLTPLLLPNVPAGTRQVTLEKDGYKTKTLTVAVTTGGLAAPPMVYLERDTSTTTPPTTIPTTGQTTIPTTSPTTISPFPGATTGTLIVYSMPFGCSVYLDDVYRGLSPVIIRDLAPGSHVVRVTFPGYQDDVRTVQVTAGKWTTVTAVLIPDISPLLAVFQ
jgi:PKD repeat protein